MLCTVKLCVQRVQAAEQDHWNQRVPYGEIETISMSDSNSAASLRERSGSPIYVLYLQYSDLICEQRPSDPPGATFVRPSA